MSSAQRRSSRLSEAKYAKPKPLPPAPQELSSEDEAESTAQELPPPSREPSPQFTGITTRHDNRFKHLGKPDMPSTRRPNGAARAEQEQKKAAKAAKAAKKDAAKDAAAAFENAVAKRLLQGQQLSNNPPTKNLGPRKSRKATPSGHAMASRLKSQAPNHADGNEDFDADSRSVEDVEIAVVDSHGGENGEDEDEVIDADGSDEDGRLPRKKGGRRGERKPSSREDIIRRRVKITDNDRMVLSSHTKRRERSTSMGSEAPEYEVPAHKKPKKNQALSGLREHWQEQVETESGRSEGSPGSSVDVEGNSQEADGTNFGTFEDEDEAAEGQGIQEIVRSNVGLHLSWATRTSRDLAQTPRSSAASSESQSMAVAGAAESTDIITNSPQITNAEEPQDLVPDVVRTQIRLKTQARQKRSQEPAKSTPIGEQTGLRSATDGCAPTRTKAARRQRYKTSDIPVEMQKQWNELLIPAAKELIGSRHDSWGSLTVDDVQGLMDQVFPKYRKQYTVQEDDAFYQVVHQRLREWRSGFAISGLEIVDIWIEYIKQADRDDGHEPTKEDLAKSVLGMLNREPGQQYNEDEEYKKNKPFYWQVWEDGGRVREGPFCSDLVLYTFYWHLQSIRGGVPADPPCEDGPGANPAVAFPIGALILSVLAVERALKIWITGERVLLSSSNPAGWFSSDNWGDYFRQAPNGEPIKMKRSSTFVNAMKKLTEKDWSEVYKGAWDVRDKLDPKRRRVRARAPVDEEGAEKQPESDADGDLSLWG